RIVAAASIAIALSACAEQKAPAAVVNITTGNGAAARPTAATFQRGAQSGKPQEIANFYATNPDCSNMGYAHVTVASPPQHGQFDIHDGETYPGFPKENIRSACNAKQVAAEIISYTSDAGFSGEDSVSIDVVQVGGGYRHFSYVIHVR